MESCLTKLSALFFILLLVACAGNVPLSPSAADGAIRVSISGGYETDPRDGGRPVVLIAAALGVPTEVFREAFSHVQPAAAGSEPAPAQVQRNKAALLSVLGPYGVTNETLDKVSDHYRFNGSAGETWPRTPAAVTAIVTNGVVTGFAITNAGSGYTSVPSVEILGANNITVTATLSYTTEFATNGSLAALTLAAP